MILIYLNPDHWISIRAPIFRSITTLPKIARGVTLDLYISAYRSFCFMVWVWNFLVNDVKSESRYSIRKVWDYCLFISFLFYLINQLFLEVAWLYSFIFLYKVHQRHTPMRPFLVSLSILLLTIYWPIFLQIFMPKIYKYADQPKINISKKSYAFF